MISGVLSVLLAEALFFGSFPLLGLFAFGFILNAIYFPLVEGPGLEKRLARSTSGTSSTFPAGFLG